MGEMIASTPRYDPAVVDRRLRRINGFGVARADDKSLVLEENGHVFRFGAKQMALVQLPRPLDLSSIFAASVA